VTSTTEQKAKSLKL